MRCEVTEMETASCAHCRGPRGPTWQAKYNGTCHLCRKEIELGELVRWSEDGSATQHASHR